MSKRNIKIDDKIRQIHMIQPLSREAAEAWIRDEEELDNLAMEMARKEDPVTLYPLCGWMEGWCTNVIEGGCICDSYPRLGCQYYAQSHPEYQITFTQVKESTRR